MRKRVYNEIYVPNWTKYQKGMAANTPLGLDQSEAADISYLSLFEKACRSHQVLEELEISKQDANRILEPWMFVELVATGTEWRNFLKLRDHNDAQPCFHELASLISKEISISKPNVLEPGQWHIPLVSEGERETYPIGDLLKISSARCARVSYFMPDTGLAATAEQNIRLYQRLVEGGHMSPCQHQAIALPGKYMVGNTVGFMQYRKFTPNEANGDIDSPTLLNPNEARLFMEDFDPFKTIQNP